MPRQPRGEEIITAIRQFLEKAVQGAEPITDGRVMLAVGCSRATFYKYVTEDSEIRREIDDAKAQQRRNSRGHGQGPEEPDQAAIIRELKAENAQLKDALRRLDAYVVKLISNLQDRGVSAALLQDAQTDLMSTPDRRYPSRGRSRSRKSRRRSY